MANKLNTVAKGNDFENRVFAKFKELLETGELPVSKHSRIEQKKSYTGKMSGRNIVFDISIETFMPSASEPSLKTLIECKDYNSPIQVDKLTDFSVRIEDVAAHKGIFVTSSKFQKGALDWAKSKGIGLVLLDKSNKESWILRRIGKQKYQIKQEIEDYFINGSSNKRFPFVGISGNNYFTSVIDFLSEMVGYDLPLPFKINYLSKETIEEIICSEFPKENREVFDYCLKTETLIDFAKDKNFICEFDNTLTEQLGYCDFQNKKISITKSLEYDSPRWRFTFAHEIGHLILHRYLFEHHNIFSIDDDEKTIDVTEGLTRILEIQANLFASKLLVPDESLCKKYIQLHKQLGLRKFPFLYVDHQYVNKTNYHIITQKLSVDFNVSKEVVKNKLLALNLLTIDESSNI